MRRAHSRNGWPRETIGTTVRIHSATKPSGTDQRGEPSGPRPPKRLARFRSVPSSTPVRRELESWTGSADTQTQVQLTFADKDAAKAYAAKHGIPARVHATPPRGLKLQAYADNFR